METILIAFRIDEKIAQRLREQAKHEDRSLSSLIRRIIEQYLATNDKEN